MELHSPYLEAIQTITGFAPGQKFRQLNLIAKNIKTHGFKTSDVPEALLPLLKVKIANNLRQSDGIVEALKSEDYVVVKQALKFNWFFREANTYIINVDYFKTRILPYITLNTRIKIIKKLALNLRASEDTKVGEAFYAHFSNNYGRNEAEPFFIACGEDFIFENIKQHKLILSCRIVKKLFEKYPDLVIRYLMLLKHDGHGIVHHSRALNIFTYADFLPKLVKQHLYAFTELIEIYPRVQDKIKLSNKSTRIFLKNNIDALLKKPDLYAPIMPLKIITSQLTKAQFKAMYAKFFPEERKHFRYEFVRSQLEFYPENERISLILETYKDLYNADLLDDHKAICRDLLAMLPKDERVKNARIKLDKEPDWRQHPFIYEEIWRCYLPIDESIPAIMTELSQSSSSDDRFALLTQIFYTCKINNDDDALIEALRYFRTRHKNEETSMIFNVLLRIEQFFDIFTFGEKHWAILDDLLKLLDARGELSHFIPGSIKFLAGSLFYDLLHDRPIKDKITMIIKLNFVGRKTEYSTNKVFDGSWSILEKYPEYNRRSFDALLSTIPSIYPQDHNIWEENRFEILANILQSMYKFNALCVKTNNKIQKLSVKNYPWLFDVLKNLVQSKSVYIKYPMKYIKSILKINEPEIYNEWIDEDEVASMKSFEALTRLRNYPLHILKHWEAYLMEAKKHAKDAYGRRFLAKSRWYQDIPIKFAERCLEDITECENSLVVLGILMEGPAFARILESLVPKSSAVENIGEGAEAKYDLIETIPHAMKMTNPPVSLSLILSFYQGDYLAPLTNVCRRTSIEKVKEFTKKLADSRVSVRKLVIQLYCLVATIDEVKIFLAYLWKNETHGSVRAVLFAKISDLFRRETNLETWVIMKKCLVDLRVDDDEILEKAMKIHKLPDEFFADYVQQLLVTLEKLQEDGFEALSIVDKIERLISRITLTPTNLMSEDFCQWLLRRYFLNPDYDKDIIEGAIKYALYSYVRPNEAGLETRLSFLCTIYEPEQKFLSG